jgi:hypothetical protein
MRPSGTARTRGVPRRLSHLAEGAATIRARQAGAAVLLLVTLAACTSGANPPEPSTTSTTTPLSMPEGDTSGDGAHIPIEPGTYLIPSSPWSVADFTVTFPAGWTAQYGHVYGKNGDEADELGFYAVVVDKIYTDSCGPEDGTLRTVRPGVDDLYAALRDQAGGAAISKPVPTTLGGYPAIQIDLRVPKRLELAECRLAPWGLQIWYSEPADKYFVLLPDATARVYVLDVDGKRQVFLAQVGDPASADDRAELQTVLDSIHIRAEK